MIKRKKRAKLKLELSKILLILIGIILLSVGVSLLVFILNNDEEVRVNIVIEPFGKLNWIEKSKYQLYQIKKQHYYR